MSEEQGHEHKRLESFQGPRVYLAWQTGTCRQESFGGVWVQANAGCFGCTGSEALS